MIPVILLLTIRIIGYSKPVFCSVFFCISQAFCANLFVLYCFGTNMSTAEIPNLGILSYACPQRIVVKPKVGSKIGIIRLMRRCIRCFGRPRKIVRGPRGTNFPPDSPNLSLCPNDSSLQATPGNWFTRFTCSLSGRTI